MAKQETEKTVEKTPAKYEVLMEKIDGFSTETFTLQDASEASALLPRTTRNILHALAGAGLLKQERKDRSLVYSKTKSWDISKAVKVNAERLQNKWLKRKANLPPKAPKVKKEKPVKAPKEKKAKAPGTTKTKKAKAKAEAGSEPASASTGKSESFLVEKESQSPVSQPQVIPDDGKPKGFIVCLHRNNGCLETNETPQSLPYFVLYAETQTQDCIFFENIEERNEVFAIINTALRADNIGKKETLQQFYERVKPKA